MSKMKMVLVAGLAILAGVVGCCGGSERVQAACATRWEMGEKSVSFCGGMSEDGTFTAKLEGDDENGYVSTVTLRDYKGPAFVARTYGTGFEVKRFIVELHGLNEVTLEDFEQVYVGGVEYELVGEGRLVVKVAEDGSGDSGELLGSFGAQTNCKDDVVEDVFGVDDAVTWVAVRVGIIGGAVAVVAAVAFGVVKLVQEVKKSTGKGR